METKIKIRKKMLKLRDELSDEYRTKCSSEICDSLLKHEWYRSYDTIYVYSCLKSEVDLTFFITQALKDNKIIAFPRVDSSVSDTSEMDFYRVENMGQLEKGAFNVLEPDLSCSMVTPKSGIWMLVPGVAFGDNGYRIGYGKGYYDRYLSRYSGVHAMGIAYESQIVPVFETDKYDIPMERLLTEKREVLIYDKA